MSTLIAGTDGSCLGNPGPAGWAYYLDDTRWAAGGLGTATNNIAELTAVRELLSAVPPDQALEIRADSTYVIDIFVGRNGARPWLPGWRRRGWKRPDGSPVKNRDLIVDVDAYLQRRTAPTTVIWVKAHVAGGGDPWNEAADARAFAASTAVRTGSPVPTGPGYR